MSGFSLLGLVVDDRERALQLLNDTNLPLKWATAGVGYPFKNRCQIHDLVLFLQFRGVNWGITADLDFFSASGLLYHHDREYYRSNPERLPCGFRTC